MLAFLNIIPFIPDAIVWIPTAFVVGRWSAKR